MAMVTRRSLLGGSLGAAALALAGCADGIVHRSGHFRSRHMPGQDIGWQLALPGNGAGEGRATPPPCVIVLHGMGGDASHAFRIIHLDDHVAATRLAVASVDGGDHYWHARKAGLDPGAMVVDDFLPLVQRETGYAGKVAFLGWSMGGYGSLLLASELGPERVAAVVAESAALWTEAGLSAPGAFDDRADFEAHDVFQRTEVLSRIPVRLDCGRSDAFVPGNRAFAAALPSARFTLDKGGHTSDYWASHGAAQLEWIREQFDRQ